MSAPASLFTGIIAANAREDLGIYGVHVHQEGVGEAEHRFRADDLVHVFSCSKTFTALAVGMLGDAGALRVTDRLVDVVPPRGEVAPGVEDITLEHLLTMTSGSSFTCFTEREKLEADVASAFFAAPLSSAPGARFDYSNGSTYMLARAVDAVAGEDLREFLMPRLFAPLGIANPQWFRCRGGHSWGAYGLHLRTAKLARLGRLLLQSGAWDGTQLVSSDWVEAMHADWVPTGREDGEDTARYGYQVWDCAPEGAWRADGNYGQYSIVLPRERAVVTVTAHLEGGRMHEILTALWRDLLPRLR
ncbi:penicillin-binding protein [Brachybacterium phenoliresistens]|uniref:Penicillin-binding protein n=1 Tax=Brachybacterium phenoliresistens TaxID=396014 RepID=Z9JQP7_9MICO|nr:serine hydrolase [Brachybacterium phenoliresistens]EWS80111.1 penicillin-binding protein [Brachybacterium phenoliresistens]